jgi:hypothetical protein
MNSSDRRGNGSGTRPDAKPVNGTPPPSPNADAYPNWLDRVQRAKARHAAITRNLYTWANYKSWADRVKTTWEDEKPPETPPRTPPR